MIGTDGGWGRTFLKFGFRTALCPAMRPLVNLKGDYQTLEEIADAENINSDYSQALEIVETILAGRQPER